MAVWYNSAIAFVIFNRKFLYISVILLTFAHSFRKNIIHLLTNHTKYEINTYQ